MSVLHPERETGLADDVYEDPVQGEVEGGRAKLTRVKDEEDEDGEEGR